MREGWRTARLADVADRQIGRTPPRKDPRYWTTDLSRPFMTIASMQSRRVVGGSEGVTELAEAEGKAKRVPKGSLLLSFKLSIGRVGIANRDVFPNEAIAWLQPREMILRDFLAIALEAVEWDSLGGRAVKGKTLNSRSLDAVEIPLPPLDEQRRIVDLIATLDDAIDAAERSAGGIHRLLLEHVTLLHEARSDRLYALQSIAPPRALIGGPFGSSLTTKDYSPEGVPVIRGTNMSNRGPYVGGDFVFVTEEKADELKRNLALPGDVIFTQRGTLGQVSLVPEGDYDRYVVSQSQMRMRVDPDRDLAKFVYYAFLAPRMVDEILSRNTATANPHINLGILGSLEIPRPPLEEQREIVGLLDSIAEAHEASNSISHRLHELRSNLLTVLLSGEHGIPESYDALIEEVAA